jgi:hypothetical protein
MILWQASRLLMKSAVRVSVTVLRANTRRIQMQLAFLRCGDNQVASQIGVSIFCLAFSGYIIG